MWQRLFLILPLFLLVGVGCAIGNKEKEGGDTYATTTAEAVQIESEEGSMMIVQTAEMALDADAIQINLEDSVVSESWPILVVNMQSGNFFFEPPLITARPGQAVEVHINSNQGLHTFVIDELGLRTQLADGAAISFIAPQKIGDYAFYCDIGEHRQLGMEGILRVTD